MKVNAYPEVSIPSGVRPAVTLGNFDGVHVGHQSIMSELKRRAEALRTPSVAVTFEPHPISILHPGEAPNRILTPDDKLEALGRLEIDFLVIVAFTVEFSRKDPESFVREVVAGKLRAAELVLGTNFRFGRDRTGDLPTLRSFGRVFGFAVREVPPALYEGEMISSSRIRRSLAQGDVQRAAAMLGRPYFVEGQVVKGDGRGRLIGFHTANLDLAGDLLVEDGVYVTSARLGDELHQGMSHVGRRPTFGLNSRTVETHIFDFSQDIYGARLRLYFHDRIRGTVAFKGPEELRRQLGADRDRAREYFRSSARNLVL